MAMHTWQMLVWDGKRYRKPTSDGVFTASSPLQALKKAGLNDSGFYTIRYSRKGYGYYTGRIFASVPETIAAGPHQPADFILEVID